MNASEIVLIIFGVLWFSFIIYNIGKMIGNWYFIWLGKKVAESLTEGLREEGYEEETWRDMKIKFHVVNKEYES